jgi:hypothetical protein
MQQNLEMRALSLWANATVVAENMSTCNLHPPQMEQTTTVVEQQQDQPQESKDLLRSGAFLKLPQGAARKT